MKPIGLDRTHGGRAAPGVLDFSASLNPLGPPTRALEAYHAAAARIAVYPEPYTPRLVARLAHTLGVAPANVLVGDGSTPLLYLLARVLRPRRPFVMVPTFSEIANSLLIAGSSPEAIMLDRERGFEPDHAELQSALEAGADAIFLGRPNSPTGTMLSLDETAALAAECERRGCCLVVDEAFIDFAGPAQSAIALLGANAALVVVRSLTKIFAIPGLRLGYVVASAELIARLAGEFEPWAVSATAEEVGLACLEDAQPLYDRTRQLVEAERAFLAAGLARLPLMRVFPSVANFLMLEVDGELLPGGFARHMLNHRIAVRDLRELPGCRSGLYRVAVRSRPDNERLLEAARGYSGRRR